MIPGPRKVFRVRGVWRFLMPDSSIGSARSRANFDIEFIRNRDFFARGSISRTEGDAEGDAETRGGVRAKGLRG
jgi:hypothetical protein